MKRALVASLALLLTVTACALLPSARQLRRWQGQTSELRELEFDSKPLTLRHVDAEQVLAVLAGEFRRSYPGNYVYEYEAAYKVLGLLPPDVDLVRVLLELQTEQVVGLYTPSDDVMYVRNDLPAEYGEIDQVVIHELVHALQARHFQGPMGLIRGLRHNDDVAAGIAAATEGDASFTMLGLPNEALPLRRDLDSARRMRRVIWIDFEHPTGVFARAPRLFQRSLLFPYAEGVVAAALRYDQAGNAGLDALMRDPPLSSQHVFEPGESGPVEFVELPTQEIMGTLGAGCFAGHHNVVGALGLQVLLEEHAGSVEPEEIREIMRGWAGDRFLHVSCPEREEFVWYTRWRSESEARRFADLYRRASASIARQVDLAKRPVPHRQRRTVVVLTAGVQGAREKIVERSVVREYDSYAAWVADGCFTESPCPHKPPDWTRGSMRNPGSHARP